MRRLALGLLLVLAGVLAHAQITATANQLTNRLHDYGTVRSGKVDQHARPVIGSAATMVTRVNLTRDQLNLAAWFGFQEFSWWQPLDLRELDFVADIPDDHYLHVWFGERDGRRVGVRLSHHARLPSAWYVAEEGRFVKKREFTPRNLVENRNQVALRVEPDGFVLRLNGKDELDLPLPVPPGRFGWTGGLDDAWIDDVRIEARDGCQWREDFDGPWSERMRWLVALGLLALVGGLLWAGRGRPYPAAFPALMVLLVLAGSAWAVRVVDARQQPLYPQDEDIDWDPYPQSSWTFTDATTALFADAEAGHPRGGRILFLGSSQTYGSGVARGDQTWVARTCALLEERIPRSAAEPDRRFQCLNGGVPGTNSAWLWKAVRDQWHRLEPDVVVVDLGNNDPTPGHIEEHLPPILDRFTAQGARILLVGEPNTSDLGATWNQGKRQVLERLAQERGLAWLDAQERLFARRDEGLLWWDVVHLTAAGQEILAEEVASALEPLLRETRAR